MRKALSSSSVFIWLWHLGQIVAGCCYLLLSALTLYYFDWKKSNLAPRICRHRPVLCATSLLAGRGVCSPGVLLERCDVRRTRLRASDQMCCCQSRGRRKSIFLLCGINNNVSNHLSSLVKIPSLNTVVVNLKVIGIVL